MVGAKIDEQIVAFHPLCERTIGLPQPACKTRRQHITWYSIFVAVRFPPQCELPSSTARSKSATSRLSWSSASEIARVTTRRGNATFAASAHAVRAPAIKVSLPASLGPTISTKRPGPMRFVGVVGGEVRVVIRGDFRHTRRTAAASPAWWTNEIGAFAGCDFTAICQPDNVRWCLAHHANGPGKIILFDF